ncbi:MAG: AMP-binding protein [Thermoanaerobaculia bacterium]
MNQPVTREASIAARFRAVAASMPDAPALVSSRAHYTYVELDRWSDAIASEIATHRAPADVPVALVMVDPVAVVPAVLAVVKAGHFSMSVDGLDPDARIAELLSASGATLCVVDIDAPGPARNLDVVRVGPVPDAPVVPPETSPHELLQLVFTSGTTGAPKAVAGRQRPFVERAVRASTRTGRSLGERVSYTAVPGNARAISEILGSLLNGATLCSFDARTQSFDELAAMIERERISTLTLTPAFFRRFLRALPATVDLSSVRKLRIGADVLTVADVDAWRARFPATTTLERAYNATETGPVLHMSITHDTPVPGPLVPMGKPVPGVEAWVVDDEGNEVPDGETGELVVRGAEVAQGYWKAPELTAERFAFDPERPTTPTFRTGDLVRRDEDGLYYFVGRRDSRIKTHGRRIDPLEVESALVIHAGAREAVVLAEPSADGELELAAYIVAGGAAADAREVRQALRGRVPAWMVPSRVHFVDALPMTRNGKVDRDAVSQRAAATPRESSPDSVVGEGLEGTILAIWSRVLRRPVEPDDDYFEDLGGTSLDALEIVAEISRVTGRTLPLSVLLELNTVRKMSGYLEAQPDMERTVIALQRSGSMPPLFCVSGKGGSVIVFRALAEKLGSEQPFYGLTYHGIDPSALPSTLAALAACFVDAIREQQPAGPYYIAGYSAGGFVAFEIARQLARAGDEVAFTGLLDTMASEERASILRRVKNYLSIVRRRPALSVVRALVRRFEWAARWIRTGGRENLFDPNLPTNQYFDSLNMRRSLQPYPGRVTLFLARHGSGAQSVRADAGWSAFCAGGVEIVEIDGEHDTILSSDVVGLARELAQALAEARARVVVDDAGIGGSSAHAAGAMMGSDD